MVKPSTFDEIKNFYATICQLNASLHKEGRYQDKSNVEQAIIDEFGVKVIDICLFGHIVNRNEGPNMYLGNLASRGQEGYANFHLPQRISNQNILRSYLKEGEAFYHEGLRYKVIKNQTCVGDARSESSIYFFAVEC